MGVVVEAYGIKDRSYRIRCTAGVLQSTFRGDSVQRYHGAVNVGTDGWESLSKITLRYAASGQGNPRCNCGTGCSTLKCRCRKSSVPCSAYKPLCHPTSHCDIRIYRFRKKYRS